MTRSLPLLALLVFLAAPLHAGGLFSTQVKKVVLLPKEKSSITIVPETDYQKMVLDLTRDDGKKIHLEKTGIKSGKNVVFSWTEEKGAWYYEGWIDATWGPKEEFRIPMEFDLVAGSALHIEVPRATINMDGHSLIARIDRKAERAEIELIGLDGVLETEETYFGGADPNSPLEVTWFSDDEVIKFTIRVWDTLGFSAHEEITPWSLEVPHEDVVFETNSDRVRASETAKLATAASFIQETLDRYGHLVQAKLYIAGYTDTVGSAADNLGLSQRRARAIASWFRASGFKLPIYYQGFGESVLAVETDDSTDLEANRRATYVLAAHSPWGKDFPSSAWKAVP